PRPARRLTCAESKRSDGSNHHFMFPPATLPGCHSIKIQPLKGPEMNRKAFYDALRPTLGALTQANVVGFERYLDEALRRSTALHDLAYILATGWWETGKTMQPVREAYWLDEDWRR